MKLLGSRRLLACGVALCLLILLSGFWDRLRYRRPVVLDRAYELIGKGEYDRAARLLAPHIREHPADDYGLRLFGVCRLNLGDEENGHVFYRRSLQRNPHQPDLLRYLEKAAATEETDR